VNNVRTEDGGTGRRRMDNVEFHNLYCLSGSRESKTVAKSVKNVTCMGMKVILNRLLIGKQGGMSPFRKPL
jgi:hypothetical protein